MSAHMKIPKATHNCQPITKLPLIEAGAFSAAKTGIVDLIMASKSVCPLLDRLGVT